MSKEGCCTVLAVELGLLASRQGGQRGRGSTQNDPAIERDCSPSSNLESSISAPSKQPESRGMSPFCSSGASWSSKPPPSSSASLLAVRGEKLQKTMNGLGTTREILVRTLGSYQTPPTVGPPCLGIRSHGCSNRGGEGDPCCFCQRSPPRSPSFPRD